MTIYKRVLMDGKKKLLHRVLWEHRFGLIPLGMEIHHKNEDIRDNRLSNLMAVTRQDHQRYHSRLFRMTRAGWVRACPLCGKEFPLTAYRKSHSHGSKKDGTQSYCKACHAKDERNRNQRKGVI